MSHTLRRGLVLLTAILVLLGSIATTAYASLDDEPADGIHGVSASNPGSGEDAWWRQGWGQTLYPDIALYPPQAMDYKVDGYIIGMLYSVDRTRSNCASGPAADVIIDPTMPDNYYRASFGGTTNNTGPYGANANNTIDLLGIYANPPAGGWPLTTTTVEGQWYMHYRFLSSRNASPLASYSGTVHTIPFGIDTTPPEPVTGLTVKTGLTSAPVTGWQPLTRAHITWDPLSMPSATPYDALSGVGYFAVLVDDAPLIPETNAGSLPKQGRVYTAPWLPTPSSITVENMPPGKHKISIIAVDRATNRSRATSAYYYSDPDTPTISITRPTNGLIKSTSLISADASDSAGAPGVKFALDGTNIATFTAPPYQFLPNLTGVLPGAHVLSATATDKLGRSVTTTMAVSTLSSVVPPSEGFIVGDDEAFSQEVTATTKTHPNIPADSNVFWRQGWGNSLYPQFEATPPSADPLQYGFATGMLYTLDMTPTTVIDPGKPANYFKSSLGGGTNLSQTVDLVGTFNHPPAGGWPNINLGGEVQPYEGLWYFHFLPFTTKAVCQQVTSHVTIGVDVTKPRAVTGLSASPSLDASLAGSWTSASRAHLTWAADRYDDLSGVAYYRVFVDDKPVIPAGETDSLGRIFEVLGRTTAAVTIEDMPPGKHKISVIAVDRATNEGPAANTYFYSDPDVPKIQLVSPTATIIQVKPSLVASASDIGGVKSVVFRIDGISVGTVTTPGSDKVSYSYTPDLSSFPAGTHVLSATVTDMVGRTSVVNKNVTLDKTPVRVTNFSRTPSIFYPVIREGYYDNSTIKYTLNKAATVTLSIRDSGGTTRKTFTAAKNAGNNSFTWDGKWASDGKVHIGSSGSATYYYQITAVDSAAYSATTSKISTTIRNYQLVKTGRNTVKVVRR